MEAIPPGGDDESRLNDYPFTRPRQMQRTPQRRVLCTVLGARSDDKACGTHTLDTAHVLRQFNGERSLHTTAELTG